MPSPVIIHLLFPKHIHRAAEQRSENIAHLTRLALEHGDGFLLCLAVGSPVELDELLLCRGELMASLLALLVFWAVLAFFAVVVVLAVVLVFLEVVAVVVFLAAAALDAFFAAVP